MNLLIIKVPTVLLFFYLSLRLYLIDNKSELMYNDVDLLLKTNKKGGQNVDI
ncbi:hypothetical protein ANASTE_00405 [Anaerofustis stercorihominis DSM 17244]|uniref:Uncharacterized protein n=1 Tax=Anaerofustis stercorihominis DSM 17244 TaxID=445971 RepID=B1C6Q8_9FIRM|nr:hypothetical protein ANASTE_00405 [Anaerofustis stercorihominis DSM 17244]